MLLNVIESGVIVEVMVIVGLVVRVLLKVMKLLVMKFVGELLILSF